MKGKLDFFKLLIVLVIAGLLYGFSSQRNGDRKLTNVLVEFTDENSPFITLSTVNKLLIQKDEDLKKVPKNILDLNGLEFALNSNPMIKSAEVYLTVNGVVRADVVQRKPIARVSTNASYYIDDEGSFMPLSTNYTARVPLVKGYVEKNKLNNIFVIANKIANDEFLKAHIIEIYQNQDETIILKTRVFDFEIVLGNLDMLDKKINNFKAFYQKAKKDKSLNKYSKVNLQFENQVVCTKK